MSQTFLNDWYNDTNPVAPYTQTTQRMGFGIPQSQGMNINFGSPQGVQSQGGGLMGIMPAQPSANQLGGMEQAATNFQNTSVEGSGGFDMDNMLGKGGWGNLALGGLQTGLGAYMGFKQLGMAKDQLDFQKRAYQENMALQKKTLNTRMEDRAIARASADPTARSAKAYMNKNEVK